MAQIRPLSLRSEKYRAQSKIPAKSDPIASIWVDSGVFHLDSPFDYLINQEIDALIKPGIRVVVPFNKREVEGIVIARKSGEVAQGLKWISKVVSPVACASTESLALIEKVRTHWAAHPYDVIRSAIPPRSAAVDKERWEFSPIASRKLKPTASYMQLPPSANHLSLIKDYCLNNPKSGSRLIIFPDSGSVSAFADLIPASITIDSEISKEERYRNFLRAFYGAHNTIIGTRSAVFLPLRDLDEVIVVEEESQLHYEKRAPGWNSRDVALLRSQQELIDLTFIGYSPSVEVAHLIDDGAIRYRSRKSAVRTRAIPKVDGELLPSGAVSEIRGALSRGPVLFLSPRKGYAQGISCAKCRNLAFCSCGGKLIKRGVNSAVECLLCEKAYEQFRCSWCQGVTPYLLSRGVKRHAFELGRTFPGVRTIEVGEELPQVDIDHEKVLVVSTAGRIPRSKSGYEAVVLLEGDEFFAWADVRGSERARSLIFQAAGFLSDKGLFILIMDSSHPVIGALASWKPSLLTGRELREREVVDLPPFSRAIAMEIAKHEVQSVQRGLESAVRDGRLPKRTKIFGPVRTQEEKSRILLFVPTEDGDLLVTMLHEFQRKRSATGKAMASIRIDPYSIT